MQSLKKIILNVFEKILLVLATVLIGAGFLVFAKYTGDGIRSGLLICATSLIPSLFPFMVFSAFLSRSSAGELISRPLRPISKYIFRIPAELGSVVLMSFIGGFPVGARMLASLVEQKKLKPQTAERMLCYCVNAGPSFLISAVGLSMYGFSMVGVLLLVTQVASSVIVGFVLSFKAQKAEKTSGTNTYLPPHLALVESVNSGSMGMFSVCAFVVFFSGVIALLSQTGVLNQTAQFLANILPLNLDYNFYTTLITGILEVTSGCISAAAIGGKTGFLLSAFFISFGSISIICQVMACFKSGEISFKPFLLSRLACGFLSVLIASPLYDRFLATYNVSLYTGGSGLQVSAHSFMLSICIIAMCAIMLMSLSVNSKFLEKR